MRGGIGRTYAIARLLMSVCLASGLAVTVLWPCACGACDVPGTGETGDCCGAAKTIHESKGVDGMGVAALCECDHLLTVTPAVIPETQRDEHVVPNAHGDALAAHSAPRMVRPAVPWTPSSNGHAPPGGPPLPLLLCTSLC